MYEDDTSITIGKPQTEPDDPINSLLIVTNKLADLENRMDYQNAAIEEIQDNLRNIVSLLEKLKK